MTDLEAMLSKTHSDVLVYGDYRWPRRLLNADTAPALLFAAGNHSVLTAGGSTAAVVGSRNPSHPNALGEARRIAAGLAEAGVTVVVSGLAQGIDSMGHIGSLEHGGRTIGVLGEGLDRRVGGGVAARMAAPDGNGCVVSQFRFGQTGRRETYFARNKTIAVLGDISIGVDLTEASGTGNELRTALRLGKTVVLWGPCMSRSRWAAQWAETEPRVLFADSVDDILRILRTTHAD